ncbi:MAG: glutathione S-transferase family protein [Gammaproteobacteria bacterium]|nr:glutathione S-transferase family protein [Gammaproteobacteria bacterium]
MALTLYGRHTSYNVQKVLWLLDELSLDYNHIELGSGPADTETAQFGQLNPMRKIPVLVDDKQNIWESNTILRYLVNAYSAGKWYTSDAYQASLVERWMDWAQTRFEPAFVGVFWGYFRTPEHLRNEEAIGKSLADCRYCLDRLDDQLPGKQFILGDRLSLADVCCGVFLYRLVEIDLQVELPEQVERWYKNLQQSAGYQRWVLSDFSSLCGRLQY